MKSVILTLLLLVSCGRTKNTKETTNKILSPGQLESIDRLNLAVNGAPVQEVMWFILRLYEENAENVPTGLCGPLLLNILGNRERREYILASGEREKQTRQLIEKKINRLPIAEIMTVDQTAIIRASSILMQHTQRFDTLFSILSVLQGFHAALTPIQGMQTATLNSPASANELSRLQKTVELGIVVANKRIKELPWDNLNRQLRSLTSGRKTLMSITTKLESEKDDFDISILSLATTEWIYDLFMEYSRFEHNAPAIRMDVQKMSKHMGSIVVRAILELSPQKREHINFYLALSCLIQSESINETQLIRIMDKIDPRNIYPVGLTTGAQEIVAKHIVPHWGFGELKKTKDKQTLTKKDFIDWVSPNTTSTSRLYGKKMGEIFAAVDMYYTFDALIDHPDLDVPSVTSILIKSLTKKIYIWPLIGKYWQNTLVEYKQIIIQEAKILSDKVDFKDNKYKSIIENILLQADKETAALDAQKEKEQKQIAKKERKEKEAATKQKILAQPQSSSSIESDDTSTEASSSSSPVSSGRTSPTTINNIMDAIKYKGTEMVPNLTQYIEQATQQQLFIISDDNTPLRELIESSLINEAIALMRKLKNIEEMVSHTLNGKTIIPNIIINKNLRRLVITLDDVVPDWHERLTSKDKKKIKHHFANAAPKSHAKLSSIGIEAIVDTSDTDSDSADDTEVAPEIFQVVVLNSAKELFDNVMAAHGNILLRSLEELKESGVARNGVAMQGINITKLRILTSRIYYIVDNHTVIIAHAIESKRQDKLRDSQHADIVNSLARAQNATEEDWTEVDID